MSIEPEIEFRPEVEFRQEMEIQYWQKLVREVWGPLDQLPTSLVSRLHNR